MVWPLSASFRCLNALRYLVRSYVTNPTTIKAMTEIPANTPRPMGRTESFFPGRVKAAPAADADACSAAATETAVPVAEELADVAGAFVGGVALVTAGATIVGLGAVVVDNAVVEGTTVETPFTETAGDSVGIATELVAEDDTGAEEDVGEEEDADAEEDAGGVGGAEDDATAEVVAGGAAEEKVEEPAYDEVIVAAIVADREELCGVEDATDVLEEDSPPLPPPLSLGGSILIVHDLTTCTASLPLLSLMGAKIITQVSVIAPAAVSVVCVVVTV